MKTFHKSKFKLFKAGAITLVSIGVALPAGAVTIFDSTGTGAYTITTDTLGEVGSLPQMAATVPAPLANNWITNPGASWIGPNSDQSNLSRPGGSHEGTNTYVTTFDLTGLDPATASLGMTFSADDYVTISLNGNVIFNTSTAMWQSLSSLMDNNPAHFISGLNTLSFFVNNTQSGGPTGLNASVSINALDSVNGGAPSGPIPPIPPSTTPEPATFIPLSLALVGGGLILRRRTRDGSLKSA